MFFLHQIKRTNGTVTKGIVVKETMDAAEQSYHAYLGAYGFGQEQGTDLVSCMITDEIGLVQMNRTWTKPETPEAEA